MWLLYNVDALLPFDDNDCLWYDDDVVLLCCGMFGICFEEANMCADGFCK